MERVGTFSSPNIESWGPHEYKATNLRLSKSSDHMRGDDYVAAANFTHSKVKSVLDKVETGLADFVHRDNKIDAAALSRDISEHIAASTAYAETARNVSPFEAKVHLGKLHDAVNDAVENARTKVNRQIAEIYKEHGHTGAADQRVNPLNGKLRELNSAQIRLNDAHANLHHVIDAGRRPLLNFHTSGFSSHRWSTIAMAAGSLALTTVVMIALARMMSNRKPRVVVVPPPMPPPPQGPPTQSSMLQILQRQAPQQQQKQQQPMIIVMPNGINTNSNN